MSEVFGRVVFYSATDLSTSGHLQDAEPILRGFDSTQPHDDVNDVLELYNIQLYIDAGCGLRAWSEDEERTFKETVVKFKPFIVGCMNRIDDQSFTAVYNQVVDELKPSFWKVFAMYKVYERVPAELIKDELRKDAGLIDIILAHQVLVKAYDRILGDYMRRNNNCIELLLSAYLLELDFPEKKPFIPASLTLEDKDQLIGLFIDSASPNISLLRIIEQAKDSNELQISPENRLKAKRKSEALYEQMVTGANQFQYSIGIDFQDPEGDNDVQVKVGENNDYTYCYKESSIKEFRDEQLVTIFATHYEYFDRNFMMIMPFNYVTDMVLMEFLTGFRSKRDYPITSAFNFKQQTAVLQMAFHRKYLKGIGKRLEDLLGWYYGEYLGNKYKLPTCEISLASEEAEIIHKIQALCPVIEKVLKRYDLFANKGKVDEEYLKYYKGVHLTDTKSILQKKYVYAVDGCRDVFLPIRLLFQSGSVMDRLPDDFQGEHNLFNTIRHTNVRYDEYSVWQKENLDYLIELGLIMKDENGVLALADEGKIAALYDIHHDRVISYWTHPKKVQEAVDKMLEEGLLYAEDSLFSKPEKDYLNFLLNDKQFTNGPALRNAYMHGDVPNVSESAHEAAYNYLLMVFVCVLLKMQSELMLNGTVN